MYPKSIQKLFYSYYISVALQFLSQYDLYSLRNAWSYMASEGWFLVCKQYIVIFSTPSNMIELNFAGGVLIYWETNCEDINKLKCHKHTFSQPPNPKWTSKVSPKYTDTFLVYNCTLNCGLSIRSGKQKLSVGTYRRCQTKEINSVKCGSCDTWNPAGHAELSPCSSGTIWPRGCLQQSGCRHTCAEASSHGCISYTDPMDLSASRHVQMPNEVWMMEIRNLWGQFRTTTRLIFELSAVQCVYSRPNRGHTSTGMLPYSYVYDLIITSLGPIPVEAVAG